jgi:hypothetical protein
MNEQLGSILNIASSRDELGLEKMKTKLSFSARLYRPHADQPKAKPRSVCVF